MSIRKLAAGEQSYNPATYVGTSGTIFYNEDTGEFRRSDGATPGGNPIPITIATSTTAGSIKPGAGFTVTAGGTLGLNAGSMFELDESNVFQLKAGTASRIGGIKAGSGVNIASDGTLAINLDEVEAFSFGDFVAEVGTYTDSTEYALLGSVKEDEDIVIASNGTGSVAVVGEFAVHATNGDVTGSLETAPIFKVSSDGQVMILVPDTDPLLGAVEIIGSASGDVVSPAVAGVMLHITGQPNQASSIYTDGIGSNPNYIGRRYNGTAASPTQVLSGQTIVRFSGQGYSSIVGFDPPADGTISLDALENFTATNQGAIWRFLVNPLGGNVRQEVASISVADGVSATKFTGPLTGNVTGDVSGSAGSVTNALTAGTYLTSTGTYNGSTARTFAVDATTTNTASKVVARDDNGDIFANLVNDSKGDVRSVPINSQGGAYNLAATDNGKMISITTGGVSVLQNVFASPYGQIVSIFNNSNSSQTITQGAGVTLRLAGTAATGNRTLARYGVATLTCVAANTFVISGAGLT